MKTERKQIWRWQTSTPPKRHLDELAVEEPLEIQVDTRPISVTMRTPGHDTELAAGFLLTEGLIQTREQIRTIVPYPRNQRGNVLNIFLSPEVAIDFSRLTRHVFMSSSCGLCGKTSIEAVHQHFPPIKSGFSIPAGLLLSLPERMRQAQEVFERTGGLHAAAIFDGAGNLIVLREDVGRHNAVDKVIGFGLLHGSLPWNEYILLVSGRASFEIMQKALAARLPVVCAISAPSSLAMAFARKSLQALVGFLRKGRMNIYSGERRILPDLRRAKRASLSRAKITK